MTMKKLIALLVALLMLLCSFAALAEDGEETAPEAITVELVENGTWVPFADYNFQICLPSDWNVLELTDEQTQTGVIAGYAAADGARVCYVSYTEFEAATDIQTVAEQLAASFEGVKLITINDLPFITYALTEQDMVGLCTLGGSGIGFYQFLFAPASDAEFQTIAESIAAYITTIEE